MRIAPEGLLSQGLYAGRGVGVAGGTSMGQPHPFNHLRQAVAGSAQI